MVTDTKNDIHIFYAEREEENVTSTWQATRDGGEWSTEKLFAMEGSRFAPRAAIDSNGFFHLVVYKGVWEEQAGDLIYVNNVDGEWKKEKIAPHAALNAYEVPGLAIDSQGFVHVVFVRAPIGYYRDMKVVYLTNNQGEWKEIAQFDYGDNPRIAVDHEGTVHVLYYDIKPIYGDYDKLTHVVFKDDSTETYIVDDTGWVGDLSVHVDKKNRLHVVFYTEGDAFLAKPLEKAAYALWDGASWSIETIIVKEADDVEMDLLNDSVPVALLSFLEKDEIYLLRRKQ